MEKLVKNQLKKFAVLLMAFLITIPLVTNEVNAASGGTLSLDYSVGWSLGGTSYGQDGIMTINGQIVYCLERTKDYDVGMYYDAIENDFSSAGFSANQAKKLSLMTYFAKQRVQSTGNMDWHAIAQNAVWKEAGNFNGWVLSPTFNTKAKIDAAIAQLEADVAQYYIKPSFDSSVQSITVGETRTFTDTNGVLSTYEVFNSSGMDVSISGNTLTVTATLESGGISMITFQKTISASDTGASILYNAGNDKQKLGMFKIGDPQSSFISFDVEQNGSLEIGKQDTSGNWISGTQFNLSTTQSTIGLVGNYTTGSNGRVVIDELQAGTYYYQETHVPAPLIIDATWKQVTVTAGQTVSATAVNATAKGQIRITKQNPSGQPIQGAVFSVRLNATEVERITSNAQGIATTSSNLTLGNYQVVEVFVPSPYVLDSTPVSVNIEYKDMNTPVVIVGREVSNDYQRSDLTLTKVENDWDAIQTEYNGIALSGATIALYAKADIYEGVTRIYRAGELIGQEVTNSVGQVSFHNLPIGEYYARELEAPEGYVLFDGQWNITIAYDSNKPTTTVTTTDQAITNQVIYGKANLVKTDGGKKLLEGAVFNVYTATGDLVVEGLVSNKDGRIMTPDLRYGDYYFEETEAPIGYWLSPERVYFTISDHEETVYVTTSNELIVAKLFVNKVDSETSAPLEGAVFKILDLNTNEFVSIRFQQGTGVVSKDTWVTDENGQFLLEASIPFGKYALVEIEAPEGYNLADPVYFTIDKDQDYQELEIIGSILETTVPNRPIRSDIAIAKVDAETGEYLANFLMRLTNLSDMTSVELLTGDDGIALFESFKYGRYMVEEVEVDGVYIIDRNPQFVDITEDGQIYEVTFANRKAKGLIEGLKVDYKDQTPLNNAKYGLYLVNDDSLVDTALTKTDGTFVFRGVDIEQEYYVQEIFSPEGYRLDETRYPVSFEYIDQDTPTIKVSLTIEEVREAVIGSSASFVERNQSDPVIVTLVDVVTFENLIVGKEYIANGILMDKITGEPVMIDGQPVTGSTTFVADKIDGSIEVFFTFDASQLQTKTVVVFEDLYEEGNLVAVHHDINDLDQTVEIPEIGSQASFGGRDKEAPNVVTVIDVVDYSGLVIGEEYTANGVLMDKATGEAILIDGQPVTGSTTFVAETTEGTVEVTFTFDSTKLETQTIVVFEELYAGERLIAVHTDIDDLDQTIQVFTVQVNKVDSLTKEALAGAEFTMYDLEGNVIDVRVSDADGVAIFRFFEGEDFEIKETNAPEGYMVSDEIITLHGLSDIDGNLYTIEYQNILLPSDALPSAGIGSNMTGPVLVFMGLFILLLVQAFKRKLQMLAMSDFTTSLYSDRPFYGMLDENDFKNEVERLLQDAIIKRYAYLDISKMREFMMALKKGFKNWQVIALDEWKPGTVTERTDYLLIRNIKPDNEALAAAIFEGFEGVVVFVKETTFSDDFKGIVERVAKRKRGEIYQ